jgi:hypothetical protein
MAKKKVKHVITRTSENTGTCGSHYCGGHTDHFAVCTCGWKEEFYDTKEFEKISLEHRVEELEKLL